MEVDGDDVLDDAWADVLPRRVSRRLGGPAAIAAAEPACAAAAAAPTAGGATPSADVAAAGGAAAAGGDAAPEGSALALLVAPPAAAAAADSVEPVLGESAERAALISAWVRTPGARVADFQPHYAAWPLHRLRAWLVEAVDAAPGTGAGRGRQRKGRR
ncbi:unnamed protein product [Prorocentrum cordatum]|uniref:Uncharacterized protein n=1 Tax=Prorocentrum cordatum TaxID=2364126 RepID=A0ABN9S1Z8_9DINO|nr:unnamed protein product [Polarella glacialis]